MNPDGKQRVVRGKYLDCKPVEAQVGSSGPEIQFCRPRTLFAIGPTWCPAAWAHSNRQHAGLHAQTPVSAHPRRSDHSSYRGTQSPAWWQITSWFPLLSAGRQMPALSECLESQGRLGNRRLSYDT